MPYYLQDPYLGLSTSQVGNVTKGLLSKTQFEKAQELASKNAETLLGLPKGNTAMERANAMGYDTSKTMYHGTPYDFNEFSRTNDIGYHFGDKWQANDRANIGGSNIMPVYLKTKNTINTNDVYGTNSNWQIPSEVRDQGIVTQDELTKLWENNIPAKQDKAFVDLLKQKNIDSIQYENMVEGIPTSFRKNGEKNMSTIVLSPNQIRSQFAAFDPARAKENDILAATMAFPISGLLEQPKDKKKKK